MIAIRNNARTLIVSLSLLYLSIGSSTGIASTALSCPELIQISRSLNNSELSALDQQVLNHFVQIEAKHQELLNHPNPPANAFNSQYVFEAELLKKYRELIGAPLAALLRVNKEIRELQDGVLSPGEATSDEIYGEYLELLSSERLSYNTQLAKNKIKLYSYLTSTLLQADSTIYVEIQKPQNEKLEPEDSRRLANMYMAYARRHGWSTEIVSGELGTDTHIIIKIFGDGAYAHLISENGTHKLELSGEGSSKANSGKFHTHRAEVLVYPAPAVKKLLIKESDFDFQYARSSGAGGQHVNRTESAVHAVHRATGLRVFVQQNRSQHENKRIAIELLTARLHQRWQDEQNEQSQRTRHAALEFTRQSSSRNVRNYDLITQSALTQSQLAGQIDDSTTRNMYALLSQLLK